VAQQTAGLRGDCQRQDVVGTLFEGIEQPLYVAAQACIAAASRVEQRTARCRFRLRSFIEDLLNQLPAVSIHGPVDSV
jgi:hypothetical protein